MKQLIYTAKRNDGFVRTSVENTSIAELLESAKVAHKIVICNKTCVVVVHLERKRLYFDCMTECTFNRVESELLKPYTRMYGGKLSVGREDDTDIAVKSHETVLYNYSARLASK